MAGSRNAARIPLPPYESDYYQWIADQVAILRAGDLEHLDAENIAEELEDLGSAVRRELQSRLELTLSHLLKRTYEPEKRTASWENTIDEQRVRAAELMVSNPSLERVLPTIFPVAYQHARRAAGNDMGLTLREWRKLFPPESPWTITEALNTSFFPKPRTSR